MDIIKGLVVAVVCLGLAAASWVDDVDQLLFALGLIVLIGPIGLGLGAIGGYVRANRGLVVVASALGCMHVLQLVGGGIDHNLLWMYPWCIVGAVAIAIWTRPAPASLPRARWIGPWMLPRPKWRRPTAVELAVALSFIVALVLALGMSPVDTTGWDDARLHEHHHHSHDVLDGSDVWLAFAMLAMIGLPLGVLAGTFVERQVSTSIEWRLMSTLFVVAVCAGHGWMFVTVLGPFDLPWWSPIAIAIAGVALVVGGRRRAEP